MRFSEHGLHSLIASIVVRMIRPVARRAGSPVADHDVEAADGNQKMHSSRCKHRFLPVVALVVSVVILYSLSLMVTPGDLWESAAPHLKLVSWNIAAINNNPFEYWISHEDAEYSALMHDVQGFLDAQAGEMVADLPVGRILLPRMLDELQDLMLGAGFVAESVNAAVSEFRKSYMGRSIISGFLKDSTIGKKRLVSMPDRVTNTINIESGGRAFRPAVDNCYAHHFQSLDAWWKQWTTFMFSEMLHLDGGRALLPCHLILPISREKYPALTESEAAMSKPLSLIALAAFDAILVHMLTSLSGGMHVNAWQFLRDKLCKALNEDKFNRTLAILSGLHKDADVIFLQEVATAFMSALRQSSLGSAFDVHAAAGDGKRDQISAILLNKERFAVSEIQDQTAAAEGILAKAGGAPIAPGDLFVLRTTDANQRGYLLGSFHGDTNGLASIPVVRAVWELSRQANSTGHELLFGLDANTYQKGDAHKQDVTKFGEFYTSLGLSSCWGDHPDPTNHTTFNARTYLQPQLNKAVSFADLGKLGVADKNPKDFILFPKDSYKVRRTWKDNTGTGKYWENVVFPTLQFPSDHGIIATEIVQKMRCGDELI